MMKVKIKNKLPTIAIDLMGSENSPEILLKALLELAKTETLHARLLAIGTQEIEKVFHSLTRRKKYPSSLSFHRAESFISLEESPLLAIRRKKGSSLLEGICLLKKKQIDGFVSAGNTGALLLGAKIHLPLLPGISRPALLACLPTKKKVLALLDVGANLSCKSNHLLQFARLGASFQKIHLNTFPTVGLLNIGTEEKKGTSEIQKTYKELQKFSSEKKEFSFIGNIEAKEIFNGNVDVVITDGFTGNVLLKTAEGMASFILDRLQEELLQKSPTSLRSFLENLHHSLHYAEYPCALLCGTERILVKCHSYSTPSAILNGIQGALHLYEKRWGELLSSYFS